MELVGEATRIPICQQVIQDVMGKVPQRTLNSQDCIARGCALQAAMLSPNFQVANFQVEEYNQQPVDITYRFKNTEKVVTKEIFKQGSSFPSTKSITFENKLGNLELLIGYGEKGEILEGLPRQIAQYDISEATKQEKTEKCSFTMRVSNNIHNVPNLDEVELVEEWTEEEKIPIKVNGTTGPAKEEKKEEAKPEGETNEGDAPKAEEPKPEVKEPEVQYEIKKRVKKNFSKIKFSTQNFAIPPSKKKEYTEFEEKIMAGDLDLLEMKQLRNALEAYSYELRNNLDSYGSWEKYLDEATRKSTIEEINKVVDWIYGDGEQAPKQEYMDKLAKFKAVGEPVKQRHFYYSELEVYYTQFEGITATI